MKAWKVTDEYEDVTDVVFASNRNEAKYLAITGHTVFDNDFSDLSYITVSASRLPELDDMEDEALVDIAECLILEAGWTFNLENVWTDENFDLARFREEFEYA